jgi:hypothetical protein
VHSKFKGTASERALCNPDGCIKEQQILCPSEDVPKCLLGLHRSQNLGVVRQQNALKKSTKPTRRRTIQITIPQIVYSSEKTQHRQTPCYERLFCIASGVECLARIYGEMSEGERKRHAFERLVEALCT